MGKSREQNRFEFFFGVHLKRARRRRGLRKVRLLSSRFELLVNQGIELASGNLPRSPDGVESST
jgi:hypothetical protein